MKTFIICIAVCLTGAATAADIRVDLNGEQLGKAPVIFEPMVGTWVVGQDGGEKVIMLDGRPWVASKDNPTKLLLQTARKLYGTSNEEFMDNAKQFAYSPVAVLRSVDNFSNGTISMKFKTVAGDAGEALQIRIYSRRITQGSARPSLARSDCSRKPMAISKITS
jgi:hypothetical protein